MIERVRIRTRFADDCPVPLYPCWVEITAKAFSFRTFRNLTIKWVAVDNNLLTITVDKRFEYRRGSFYAVEGV